MLYLLFKRIIDVSCSSLAILVLSPVFVIVPVIIFLQDFGPPIFKQQRVGECSRIFMFYKFRSMPVKSPNVQSLEVSKLKITPFGKFLRRFNIDELPQLINILKGDMSIVGPRPPIPSQVDLISLREENGSIKCKPGLTGWAQVNAYDYMPVEEKAKLDKYYSDNISLSLDVKIILKTFKYLTKKPPTY